MPYLSLDTFLELVLPKLVGMTLLGFVAASAVGGLVGWIATLIWRRLQHQRGLENAQSAPSLVSPAIHGAFISLLLGMLTYEANPASLFGGPYSGLARYISYLLILPSSSFTGAIIGAVAGAKLPTVLKQPGLAVTGLAVTYVLAAGILYLGLAPASITLTTPQTNEPFPTIARISGYNETPKSMALSANGEKLAVAIVSRGEDNIDIWDLPSKKVIHRLRSQLRGSATLKDILTSMAFSSNGEELITAAPYQVQVRNPANQQVRLRLDGGSIALPMAENKLVSLSVVEFRNTQQKLDPFNLKVWDLKSGRLLHTLPADLEPVNSNALPIAIHPDRRLIAFPNGNSDRIAVWDVITGKQVSLFGENSNGWPKTLDFSPDGRLLAVSMVRQKPLLIWDWQEKRLAYTLPQIAYTDQLHWTTQGILAQYEGRIDLINPQTGKIIKPVLAKESAPLFSVSLSTMSQDAHVFAIYTKQGITVWQLADGAVKRQPFF